MPKFSQQNILNSDKCIDFSIGQPKIDMSHLNFFKEALISCNSELDDPEILQYSNISGYPLLKKSLTEWLNKKKYSNHQVNEKELFIINGITDGLQIIMNQYLSTDDVILVEEPSYFLAVNIFKEYGLNVDYIPINKDGIDLEVLESKVRKYSAIQKSIFLYTIPTCHNPTGYTITDEKRKQLAAIATVYTNFYIIADETYHFIRWDDNKILPLADYHCNFISLCSFSKMLAPSLRVGWLYINTTFKDRIDDTNVIEDIESSSLFQMSGGTNLLGSLIVDKAISSGFLDENLTKLVTDLKLKCNTLTDILNKSSIFTYDIPNGGYCLWIKSKLDTQNVLDTAKLNKIKYDYGNKFSYEKSFDNYLQINFSYYDIDILKLGLEKLINIFEDYDKIKIAIMGNGKMSKLISEMITNKYSKEYLLKYIIKRGDFDNITTKNILESVDIIIDFSSKEGTVELINYLNSNNISKPILSGTTGHDSNSIDCMKKYSKSQQIMNINNFSNSFPIIKNIIELINKLPDSWNINIFEKNKNNLEQFSETTKIIKSLILRDSNVEIINDDSNSHLIVCSDDNEMFSFNYQIINSEVFAKGCIDMIPEVFKKSSGFKTDINIIKENIDTNIYSTNGNIICIIEDYEGDYIKKVLDLAKNDKIDGFIFMSNLNSTFCKCDWKYYNRYGKNADFSGNGIRCLMKYVYDNHKLKQLNLTYNNLTDSDLFLVKYDDNNIKVQSPDHVDDEEFNHMTQNELELECEKLGIEVIDMEIHHVSVPHLIIELKEDVHVIKEVLEVLGNILLEYYSESVDKDGININFINLNNDTLDHSINIITLEKDVNKFTESCGSGSVAAFYYYLNDNTIRDHNSIVDIHYHNGTSSKIIEEDYFIYLEGIADKYDCIITDQVLDTDQNEENVFRLTSLIEY